VAKTTVELPAVLHRKLRVKAALENSSMNELVVEALEQYLQEFRLEPGMLEVEAVVPDQPRRSANGRTTSRTHR
jgi:hypothetical protein